MYGAFQQLWSSVGVQDEAMREHKERLSSAEQKATQLVRHQKVVLQERVEQVSTSWASRWPSGFDAFIFQALLQRLSNSCNALQ
jgi:hypothetical protein